jgi:alpha-beta hydrolase superfamily lysophospholipase
MRARRDLRPLAAVAALVTLLVAAGLLPSWAGALHHVALPPLDLMADVRVLLAEASSYPAFVVGVAAVLALRCAVLAAMLGAIDGAGFARAARFYAAALPFAIVAGGLGFSGTAVLYSPFLWTAAALTLAVALVAAPRPWRGAVPAGRVVARVAAYLAGLLVLSLPSALGTSGVRVILVWCSAALTAVTIRWLERPAPRSRNTAAVVLVVGAALLVVLGVAGLVAADEQRPATARRMPGTLFVVPGIGGASGTSTMFRLDPAAIGFTCDQTVYFSYAGPGDGAPQRAARCSVRHGAPYVAADTHRPLHEAVATFREQYTGLDPPVVVIAHSQGAWIAAAALRDAAGAVQPSAVVLVGAFPAHRGGYQLDGTGRSLVATDLLEVLTAGLRGLGATSFDPRAPLPAELLGTEGAVDEVMRHGFPPGVPVAAVTSAFDLPIMAAEREGPGITSLCPLYVHHGSLPRAPQVEEQIRAALAGEPPAPCPWWRRWPARAFAAFGVPVR